MYASIAVFNISILADKAFFSVSLLVTSECKVFNSALYALIFCWLVLISDSRALILLSFSSIKEVIRLTSAFASLRACSSSALSLVAFASSSFFWANNAFSSVICLDRVSFFFLSAFNWSSSLVKASFCALSWVEVVSNSAFTEDCWLTRLSYVLLALL